MNPWNAVMSLKLCDWRSASQITMETEMFMRRKSCWLVGVVKWKMCVHCCSPTHPTDCQMMNTQFGRAKNPKRKENAGWKWDNRKIVALFFQMPLIYQKTINFPSPQFFSISSWWSQLEGELKKIRWRRSFPDNSISFISLSIPLSTSNWSIKSNKIFY